MRLGGLLWFGYCLIQVQGKGYGVGRSRHEQLRARQELEGSTILAPTQSMPDDSEPSSSVIDNFASTTSSTNSPSTTSIISVTIPQPPSSPPTSPPSPVPTPLDLSVSYSLSNDCLLFISTFLTSSLFKSCTPLSLLLTTSTSYRQLVRDAPSDSYSTLNNLLAYTNSPQPGSKECTDYFSGLSESFKEKKHCSSDLKNRNPTALDVSYGLGNYEVVREAAGLIDPDEGEYCYLKAMADGRPDDMYLWSIPAGIATSTPICSKCSGLLLNHYSTSLSTSDSLNSTIVRAAADTINAACGGSFVTFNSSISASPATFVNDRLTTWVILAIATSIPLMTLGL